MRIDKLLANQGFGSRKEVKKLLKEGHVTVNGEIIKDGKTHIDPYNDEIYVFSEKMEYRKISYVKMNKPSGYISATEDEWKENVLDLLDLDFLVYRPFPVGRLDKDTEGLLLLTNDGKLAHQLLSP